MTTSGEPPSGAGGVSEPDWIDQILERASSQVAPVDTAVASEPPIAKRAPVPADGLAEIRWVDEPQVTPASTPIVPAQAHVTPASTPIVAAQQAQPLEPAGLVPQSVGRSAWDDQLASVGETDPEGWDKLSWQDLDANPHHQVPLQGGSTSAQLLREWGPVLLAAIAIALFTRLVLVQAYHIPSQSMVPTLEDGDRVVVNRLSYQFGEVERGQVVVFAKPQGTAGENDLIKRVIGLPGETIRFVDNQVYINGLRVEEPYLAQQDSTRPRLTIPGCSQLDLASDLCVIPDDHVFVMGDNRLGSSDSRVFGPIPTESIVGRAFMRVWPLNNLGQL